MCLAAELKKKEWIENRSKPPARAHIHTQTRVHAIIIFPLRLYNPAHVFENRWYSTLCAGGTDHLIHLGTKNTFF